MPDEITVYINGRALQVSPGTTAAAAVLLAGAVCRTSVSGEPRTPLCGMGTCFECRVEINGAAQQRSCQVLCEPRMEIRSGG